MGERCNKKFAKYHLPFFTLILQKPFTIVFMMPTPNFDLFLLQGLHSAVIISNKCGNLLLSARIKRKEEKERVYIHICVCIMIQRSMQTPSYTHSAKISLTLNLIHSFLFANFSGIIDFFFAEANCMVESRIFFNDDI